MSRGVFSRYLVIVAVVALVLASSVYAEVVATDPKTSEGEEFVVGVLDEGALLVYDRAYTMTEIPEKYLGLTCIMTSMDTVADESVQWMFGIDQPAYVYMAFDDRWAPPEERAQNPEGWFSDGFTKTGETILIADADPQLTYWIYKSNEPYPAGTVTIQGLGQGGGDGVYRVTFLQGADMTAVSPQEKLAGRWGEIKSLK